MLPQIQKELSVTVVDSQQSEEKTLDDVLKHIEPCVVHIRPGANSNDLRKEITEKLSEEHGFRNLDINGLIRDENERKTEIGQEMN